MYSSRGTYGVYQSIRMCLQQVSGSKLQMSWIFRFGSNFWIDPKAAWCDNQNFSKHLNNLLASGITEIVRLFLCSENKTCQTE